MHNATFILLCLVVFGISVSECSGLIGGASERCLCRGKLMKRVKTSLVGQVKTFLPSRSCSKTEIVVVMKTNRTYCLDPKGHQGKRILNNQGLEKQKLKQRRWRSQRRP